MTAGHDTQPKAHYTVDFEPDDEDWYEARCNCGRTLGLFPTAEDCADALMQHAYEQGILDERAGRG